MRRIQRNTLLVLAAAVLLALVLQAQTGISDLWIRFPDGTIQTTAAHNCTDPNNPDDEMIRVGGLCIDKYEASIWDAPVGGNQIFGTPCSEDGQDCVGVIYARSVAGVPPAQLTWFQAQQALANSGKRLPTNAEWQMAAAGTPDNINCNIGLGSTANTGSFVNCLSDWGAFDMVGNVDEWVADWVDQATHCTDWLGDDFSCFGLGEGQTNSRLPGGLLRGGQWASPANQAGVGPFTVNAREGLTHGGGGFRGIR